MLGPILFIVALVSCVGLITFFYRRQPLKRMTLNKPSFVFFPKYVASYQRSDEDVDLSIRQLGFRPSNIKDHYFRGTVRNGLSTKSISLTIVLNREKKEIEIFSSLFGILFDNGDIWKLAHDTIHGIEPEKDRTQELHDLFDNKK